MKTTVDRLALAAVLFSVVAIVSVTSVAVVSVRNLASASERVAGLQRVLFSLESLRFSALTLDASQQAFVITNNREELSAMSSAGATMKAELAYLSDKRSALRLLEAEFAVLEQAVVVLIQKEGGIAELRRLEGFNAAQAAIRKDEAGASHEQVLSLVYRMTAEARKKLDQLDLEQASVSEDVHWWLVVLLSVTAAVLVVLYVALRRISISQRMAQEKIAHQATHDGLTGLHNRTAVIEHLTERLVNGDTERALGGFAVMMLDLDGFKSVNDRFGHDAGDELLKHASARMQTSLRDTDFLARLGGDEFLIVIPQVSDRETASLVARKLIVTISEPYTLGQTGKDRVANQVSAVRLVTASIGISFYPADGTEREALMKAADNAMYAAKRGGRNQFVFFADVSAER